MLPAPMPDSNYHSSLGIASASVVRPGSEPFGFRFPPIPWPLFPSWRVSSNVPEVHTGGSTSPKTVNESKNPPDSAGMSLLIPAKPRNNVLKPHSRNYEKPK